MPSLWDAGCDPDDFITGIDHIDLGTIPIDALPLTFGKYRGKTPAELLAINPQYINWLVSQESLKHLVSASLAKKAKHATWGKIS